MMSAIGVNPGRLGSQSQDFGVGVAGLHEIL